MPVNVIGTIKPKNGADFPVVEAVDVFVEGYTSLADAVSHFATQAMIAAITTALSGKANTSDVNTAVTNLQNQINQIEISASAEAVVAPEVAAARVGVDNTTYTTLKERLDAEYNLQTDVIDELREFDRTVAEDFGYYTDIDVSYTTHRLPKNDGTFYEDTASNPSWFATDYIEIEQGTQSIEYCGINYNIGGTKITPLAFYNSSKIFISCVPVVSGFAPVSGTIDVPTNAKYFIQSKYYNVSEPERNSNNYTKFSYGSRYDLSTMSDAIASDSAKIYNIESEIFGGYGKPFGEDRQNTDKTTYIWFQYAEPVHVTKIKFKARQGTINFYKIHYIEGESTYTSTLITSVENTSTEQGSIKEIAVDVPLTENEYIGINGAFYYANSDEYYTRQIKLADGTISNRNGQHLDFIAIYDGSVIERITDVESDNESLGERVTNIESELNINKSIRPQGEVVLYEHKFAASDADWEGTQAFNNYGMAVTSRVYLNKAYAVSDRTVKYVCKFNSTSTAYFDVVASNGTTVNTSILVDIPNKTVGLVGETPTACDFLNSTDEFLVSITKYYQDLRINVTNIYTGDEINVEYIKSGTGGTGQGAVERDNANSVPMQHMYYSLTGGATLFSVSKIIVVSSKCDLLIYGDSITEGEAYWPHDMFNKHWVQLLVQQTSGKALASGRSGGAFFDIYARMQNEIPFIKPKYVMVTTGTNGGDSVQNYTTLVQYIKSQGCIPILNHIPCYDNDGDTTGFRTANANIDTVRESESVAGADFDLATSTAHDGQNIDTSTMWFEDGGESYHYYHHPNVKGCAAMFQRILIDIPEIFDL